MLCKTQFSRKLEDNISVEEEYGFYYYYFNSKTIFHAQLMGPISKKLECNGYLGKVKESTEWNDN